MSDRPIRTTLSTKNLLFRGVPKQFLETTIDDFKTYNESALITVKNTVADYIKDLGQTLSTGSGLYLFGTNGVGKSMLGSIIVREAYRQRYSSKRITFVEYLDRYTRIWKAESVDEKDTLEDEFYSYIKAVDFLVLEEVGKELSKPEMAATVLEDCLRYREEHSLCTIICTNNTIKDLNAKYHSKSIESLMRGSMKPLLIMGIDRRVEYEKR